MWEEPDWGRLGELFIVTLGYLMAGLVLTIICASLDVPMGLFALVIMLPAVMWMVTIMGAVQDA